MERKKKKEKRIISLSLSLLRLRCWNISFYLFIYLFIIRRERAKADRTSEAEKKVRNADRTGQDRTGWDCLESCPVLVRYIPEMSVFSWSWHRQADRCNCESSALATFRRTLLCSASVRSSTSTLSSYIPVPPLRIYDTVLYTPGLASLVLCCTQYCTHHDRQSMS